MCYFGHEATGSKAGAGASMHLIALHGGELWLFWLGTRFRLKSHIRWHSAEAKTYLDVQDPTDERNMSPVAVIRVLSLLKDYALFEVWDGKPHRIITAQYYNRNRNLNRGANYDLQQKIKVEPHWTSLRLFLLIYKATRFRAEDGKSVFQPHRTIPVCCNASAPNF
jgi:hypothetical protein